MKEYTYVMESCDKYDGKSLIDECIASPGKMTTQELVSILLAENGIVENQDYGDLINDMQKYGRSAELKKPLNRVQQSKAKALSELVYRMSEKRDVITTPNDAFMELRYLANEEQENFCVMCLNGAHVPVKTFIATTGLLNRTMIHPREVFSIPIQIRCDSVIIAHNHPSGVLDPSADDIQSTTRLVESGNLLGIRVLDHLIFSHKSFYSFKEHGLM